MAFFSFKILTCFYWMGLFVMKSHHSRLAAYLTTGLWHLWNILWFMSPVKIVKPLLSLLNDFLKETSPTERRSYTNNHCDSQHSAAARCRLFLGQLKKGQRGRESEREKGEERQKDGWEEVKPEMLCPRGIYQPKWNGNSERETLLCFSQNCISSWMNRKENILSFFCVLRDLFAKSAGLVGETRNIYFPYTLVIYEVAINAEFMGVKSGHEIKRILFKYLSLLILSNSSQRRRWVRMHTRFTEF